MEDVRAVVTRDMVLEVQNYLSTIRMTQAVLRYMTVLCERTREDKGVELGVSPRGIIALSRMARAKALLEERDYVVPEDVRAVFHDVCGHRVILKPQARMEGRTVGELLEQIMETTEVPEMPGKAHVPLDKKDPASSTGRLFLLCLRLLQILQTPARSA